MEIVIKVIIVVGKRYEKNRKLKLEICWILLPSQIHIQIEFVRATRHVDLKSFSGSGQNSASAYDFQTVFSTYLVSYPYTYIYLYL